MKILFLLKKNANNYTYCKSGLLNSATFVKQYLEQLNIDCSLQICVDSNSIDREVHLFKPDVCILEAIWFTPDKIKEITKRHPSVIFVIRVHSEVPFLAQEGVAFDWISEFININNVHVSFNSAEACKSMGQAFKKDFLYLPNIYTKSRKPCVLKSLYLSAFYWIEKIFFDVKIKNKTSINIGCFGAIRPFKNQVAQIVAAISFANIHNVDLNVHINSTRTEQGGENVLKNIRALFKMTNHQLIEHKWLDHDDFLNIVKYMDVGMQISFNESFNIVTADFINQKVPIVVSNAIRWMPYEAKANPISHDDIIDKLTNCFNNKDYFVDRAERHLHNYNESSKTVWKNFIQQVETN